MLLAEIVKMHTTPAGLQVLTIFQCDKLEERPVSVLDNAVELVAAHRRLSGETKNAGLPNTHRGDAEAGTGVNK